MKDTTEKQHRVVKIAKENIRKVHQDLQDYMVKTGRQLVQLRARLILFRDYLADGEDAMLQTGFFQIPQQLAEFEEVVNCVHADGGGDEPEDGLEALAYAIRSDWTTLAGVRKRQVIVIWSDTGTHQLGHGKESAYYPRGMASSLEELEDWWEAMNDRAKRLIILAPDTYYWNYIGDNWNHAHHIPSAVGTGLSDHQYRDILGCIVHNI